jgi:hypothetical protein
MSGPESPSKRHAGTGRVPTAVAAALLGVVAPVRLSAAPGLFEAGAFPPVADEVAAVDVALADLDGDGDRDAYVVFGRLTGAVDVALPDRVYLNQGNGTFADSGWTLDGADPQAGVAVAIVDLDLDGWPDAIVAGGQRFDGTGFVAESTRVYRHDGTRLIPAQTLGPVIASSAIATTDWDADGDPDIAIGRARTFVDLYRNDGPGAGPGSALTFTEVQRLRPHQPGTNLRGLRFAQFAGDGFADLVAGYQVSDDGADPAGLSVYRNNDIGGVRVFQHVQRVDLPGRFLHDLATGDLDGTALADVVVAATWIVAPLPAFGASFIAYGTPAGLAPDSFRFPLEAHVAVEIGDVGIDGLRDIVFGVSRCAYGPCPAAEVASIGVWVQVAGDFVHNGQCMGRHSPAAQGLALGDLDNDDLADVFVTGGREAGATLSADGVGWLRNNGAAQASYCCAAQVAAAYAEDGGGSGAGAKRVRAKAAAAVDLDAYAEVRDVLMERAVNGPRLRARYQQFSPEVAQMMLTDPSLWSDGAAVLSAWSGPLRALLDADGASAFVTQAMMDGVDTFLVRLSGGGSAALAQTIAEERALLPPFATFVGMDMDEFLAAALPADALFGDGFETPPAP